MTLANDSSKYCIYCEVEHPLTSAFWRRVDHAPSCKRRAYITHKTWVDNNRIRHNKARCEYYRKNTKKIITANSNYASRRKKIDINYKMAIVLRDRFSKALNRRYKAGSAVRDLGCSIEEFVTYLSNKFLLGMTWATYGRTGWHIDHIQPLSSFDLTDFKQLQIALHYTNLQPLWSEDNIRKSNKAYTPTYIADKLAGVANQSCI